MTSGLPLGARRVAKATEEATGRDGPGSASQQQQRRARERRARMAEALAATVLMLKGYRILARRFRASGGEIDIVAVRMRRLAFVEVKQRASLALSEQSVTPRQARRIEAAAMRWLQQYPRYRDHKLGFDRFDVVGLWQFRHVPDALQPIA